MLWYKKSILTFNLGVPGLIGGFLLLAGFGIRYYFSDELSMKKVAYNKFINDETLLNARLKGFKKNESKEKDWQEILSASAANEYSLATQNQKLQARHGEFLRQPSLNIKPLVAKSDRRPANESFDVTFEGSWKNMLLESLDLEYLYPQLHLESAVITNSRDGRDSLSFRLTYTAWQVKSEEETSKK